MLLPGSAEGWGSQGLYLLLEITSAFRRDSVPSLALWMGGCQASGDSGMRGVGIPSWMCWEEASPCVTRGQQQHSCAVLTSSVSFLIPGRPPGLPVPARRGSTAKAGEQEVMEKSSRAR